jgi:predicted RNA-binding Zn-ribbon protein involved in translation (DUF1610 family)
MIYFCQGCSAVLSHRVSFCPHCGEKQFYNDECDYCGADISETDEDCTECGDHIRRDEDNPRTCPVCGYELDIDGRNLNLKYCSGTDCGREIGGLIRYSVETGEQLTVDEILKSNDYKKEITDWISSIFYFNGFYERMLYIYDKTSKYTSKDFLNEFSASFKGIDLFGINDFSLLANKENYQKFMIENKYSSKKNLHCICAIDIGEYSEKIEAHDIIEYCKDIMALAQNMIIAIL